MNMNTETNVVDFNEHKLTRVAKEIHAYIHQAASAWRQIGERLIVARAEFSSNTEFGQWVDAQGFGLKRGTLWEYRIAAEFVVGHDQQQLPSDFLVLRKAAALPAQKQAEAVAAWSKGEALTRAAFAKMFPAPKRHPAATESVVEAKPVSAMRAEVTALAEQLNAVKNDLPETDKQRLKRAETIQLKTMQADYQVAVAELEATLEGRVKDLRAKLEEATRAADLEKERYEGLNTRFDTIMTRDQFRLVRSCLHPDRVEVQRDKLAEAFAIFNRLEKCVNTKLPIAELRRTGWETLSPYYKK